MDCRERKITRKKTGYCLKNKLSGMVARLWAIALVAVSVAISGYQSSKPLKSSLKEEHLDMFRAQYHYRLENQKTPDYIKNFDLLRQLYAQANTKPLWTTNYVPNSNAASYLNILSRAAVYGLDSSEYHLAELRRLEHELLTSNVYLQLARTRVDFELLMSGSAIRFATALKRGVRHERSTAYRHESPEGMQLIAFLVQCCTSNNFKKEFLSCQPASPQYKNLQAGLERLMGLDYPGEYTSVLAGKTNDPVELSRTAKEILISLQYLKTTSDSSNYSIALKIFQKHHSISPSGMLDQKTRKALAMTIEERHKIISLNLERLRQEEWAGEDYLYVNIPSFLLKVYENNKVVTVFKTVIGKPSSPTPVFSGRINQIVTHPSWFVPQSISSKDLLNKVRKDSTYLSANHYIVYDRSNNEVDPSTINWHEIHAGNFRYRLVQLSSEKNALGALKFMFPNNYDVYVHDTPSKSLFNNDFRAYSYGCVRLQHPEKLAEYIIKKQNSLYAERKLKRNLSGGIQEAFYLKVPMDIHLRYYTCEADEYGNVYFYEDIYNLDPGLLQELTS